MTFEQIAGYAANIATWLESFATTPREQIDLEGMAALARLTSTVKTALAGPLSTPASQADIARVGAMIKQDLPGLAAPAPMPVDAPQPVIQDGVRGGGRGGLMAPGS